MSKISSEMYTKVDTHATANSNITISGIKLKRIYLWLGNLLNLVYKYPYDNMST